MNYVKLSWSNPCNIPPAFYTDGFMNSLYFVEDFSPDYGVKVDGKEAKGRINSEKIVWKKNLIITVQTSPATAEILSTIPLHDNVYLQDKNGDIYNCAGADVEVDISNAGKEVLNEKEHAIVSVTLTFLVEVLTKTGCCDLSLQEISCSAVAPTIDNLLEPSDGVVIIEGTAPTNMYVQWLGRERQRAFKVVDATDFLSVCIVGESLVYAGDSSGNLYKSTDKGNTYTYVDNLDEAINSIVYGSGNYAYIGCSGGNVFRINKVNDFINLLGQPSDSDVTAMSTIGTGNLYVGYSAGKVKLYSAGTFTSIYTGSVLPVTSISQKSNTKFIVTYNEYVYYSGNSGASYTAVNIPTFNILSSVYYESDTYIIGMASGAIYSIDPIVGIGTLTSLGAIPTNATCMVKGLAGLTEYLYVGNLLYYCEIGVWTFSGILSNTGNVINALSASMDESFYVVGGHSSGTISTSMSDFDIYQTKIADEYVLDGMTETLINDVSYEFFVRTLLPSSICAKGDSVYFTT